MGYTIEFNLEIYGVYKKDKDKLSEDIKTLCPEFAYNLESNGYIFPLGSYDSEEISVWFTSRWPERYEELGDLTFKYPDIEIMLSCIGEDGFRWQEKHQNGECSNIDFEFQR